MAITQQGSYAIAQPRYGSFAGKVPVIPSIFEWLIRARRRGRR